MRTLKLALAAVAAFALDANAAPVTVGMGNGTTVVPPNGNYQAVLDAASSAALAGPGFHAGGVAACDGCHVMHNASGGVAKSTVSSPWTNTTNAYLLQGSDQSSTCLICHSGAKSGTIQFTVADVTTTAAPTNFTPGGDFGWLKVNFGAGNSTQRKGHNVAAADFGLAVDADLKAAPGGTYAGTATGKAAFACSNCHDPHGRYRMQEAAAGAVTFAGPLTPTSGTTVKPIKLSGSYGDAPSATFAVGAYRLLAGKGYAPASNAAFPFPNDPPIAVAPPLYNQAESRVTQTKVAYGSGMSEWCQNCHTNIHLDTYITGRSSLRHPAGSTAFLHTGQYEVYNKYLSTGDMTATDAQAYNSLVPFEQTGNNIAALKASITAATGITAGASSAVMCLSCHRAHASGFDSMIRWDQNLTFLTDTTILSGNSGRTAAQNTAAYYGRSASDLGNYQRSLCNKCHGKD